MKKLRDEDLEFLPQINIVPMIDVIFAILTFFIMATLFLTRSEGLPVNLPEASTAENQVDSQITITLDAAGNISLNRKSIQLDQVATKVQALLKNNKQAFVAIEADAKVEHGRVIDVMDRLRTIKNVKLSIGAKGRK